MLCKGTETMSFRLSYHRVNNPGGYFSSLFNFYGIGKKKRLIFYLEFEGLRIYPNLRQASVNVY